MTYYPQGQQPATPSPVTHGAGHGKRPRPWHIAAALTLALFVAWFIVALAAGACPSPKPAVSSSGSGGTSLTRADADRACQRSYLTVTEKQRCSALAAGSSAPCAYAISDISYSLCGLKETVGNLPTSSSGKKSNPVCESAGSIQSTLMLGQLVGIVVTAVLGWKRRRTYTQFRRAVFAVEDYARRVPPGSESYVDLATHQMAASAAMNASTEMFMNRSYWFAPSGPAVEARIDAIRATGARAAAAAQQIQLAQYAPMDDEPEDLAAPDLGGGDTTSETASDDADDWMSGVDNNDNDW